MPTVIDIGPAVSEPYNVDTARTDTRTDGHLTGLI